MSWEAVRRRRLPLHYLRGTWQAVALSHPDGFSPNARWQAFIQLHPLRRFALNGLHNVYVFNLTEDEAEFDHWDADLDIDEHGQMLSAPFWNLERLFENNCQQPLETVAQSDAQTLTLTVWHGWDRVTPRRFRLTKLNDELPE